MKEMNALEDILRQTQDERRGKIYDKTLSFIAENYLKLIVFYIKSSQIILF